MTAAPQFGESVRGPMNVDPLFVEISEATKRVGLMEELHGTDSIEHQRALGERDELVRRWREVKRTEASTGVRT